MATTVKKTKSGKVDKRTKKVKLLPNVWKKPERQKVA